MATVIKAPPATFTGIPVAPASDILGPGSLVLLDFNNPRSPDTSGVPAASGTVFTDLARSYAKTLIGSDPGGLAVTNGVASNSAKSKVERTAKRGLHFMNSRTTQASPYEVLNVNLGTTRLAYINANPTHDFYLGAWFRVTRVGDSTYANPHLPFGLRKGNPTSTAGDRWLLVGPNTGANVNTITYNPLTSDTTRHGGVLTQRDGSGPGNYSFFVGVCALQAPASFTAIDAIVRMGAESSGPANKFPSIVLWRLALIDLTADGRSFATISALDQAEYVQQVLTPDGYYYGDTMSNPATVLP